jgi:TM2 domain-containing membrane protein YozV
MLQCPHCRNGVDDATDLAGQLVFCPFCRGQFQMPAPVAVASIVSSPAYRSSYSERGPQNSPRLAAVLSFLFVGLGQIYNGQFGKGLLLIVLQVIFGVLAFFVWPFAVIPVAFWRYGMMDAFAGAESYNRRRR